MTEIDDFLAHHGVKGMKWGKSTAGGPSRSDLRSMNKASKAKDKAARDAGIDAARDRYNNGARESYKTAKAQYKADKAVIGKREAAKAFNKVKDRNIKDYQEGSQFKSGKENTTAVLAMVGTVVLYGAVRSALRG